jgi:GNAT superfamily N-acetyltransferase
MGFSYDIVSYRPEFKEQVLELQTWLWGPNLTRNREYFEWKHEHNPYMRSPLAYLALHGGKVVGMRTFFGTRWEAGSPPQGLSCVYADDMVVAPEHRNRGLSSLIMSTAFKGLERLGYEYVVNLSAGAVTFLSSLSMGWKCPGLMQPMRRRSWRLASVMAARRLVGRRLQGLPPRSLADVDSARIASRFGESPSIVFALTPRVDDMAALVQRIGHDGRITHVRDRTYLHWRFQNPQSRYGFLYCEQQGFLGYLVLQEYTAEWVDNTQLNIVDWEATNGTVLKRLLRAAHHVAGPRRQLGIWSATLSQEKLRLLSEDGFRVERRPDPTTQRPALLVRALAPGCPAAEWRFAGRQLVNLAEWDLRMLYSMRG